jgi:hypothetical protein
MRSGKFGETKTIALVPDVVGNLHNVRWDSFLFCDLAVSVSETSSFFFLLGRNRFFVHGPEYFSFRNVSHTYAKLISAFPRGETFLFPDSILLHVAMYV